MFGSTYSLTGPSEMDTERVRPGGTDRRTSFTSMCTGKDKKSPSFLSVWRDFLGVTTLHGCRNMEDRRRGPIYRVLWTLMFLGMLGGLVQALVDSSFQYYKYKITSKSSVEAITEMPFPAVTVCSSAPYNTFGKNISESLRHFFAKSFRKVLLKKSTEPVLASPELNRVTLADVFDEFTFSNASEFIIHHSGPGSQSVNFTPIITPIGKCFVANGNGSTKVKATLEGRTGGLQMILNLHEHGVLTQGDLTFGAMIFVHDTDDFARTLENGVMVAPGHSFYINVKPTTYNFLPKPYKSYGRTYCVRTSRSYEGCILEWASKRAAITCNCTSGVESEDVKNTFQSCTLRRLSVCYNPQLVDSLLESLQENFTACRKPCTFTRYETSISFSKFPSQPAVQEIVDFLQAGHVTHADQDFIRRNILKVTIYFDRFFIQRVDYEPEVTVNAIFGQLGGQMGFFLGASLLTVLELGETVIRSLLTLCAGGVKSPEKHTKK